MANPVIITTRCASSNVDALNRSAVATVDMVNGTPVVLAWSTEEGDEVFKATKAGAGAKGVWLTHSPEVNKLVVGAVWGGDDPRNFANVKDKPMDVMKPTSDGCIIQVTKDFFNTGADPDSVANATVVELTANGFEAKATATANYTGIAFKIGRKEPIIIASGSLLVSEQVDAWYLECTNN